MHNPILPGFHPDPSIVRVGADYYLATSTFEWYPGVQIYHSRDLVNWTLVARPLDRPDLIDLKGVPDSCGVWAPCLSHDGARFHLVYSQVRSFDGLWKDTPNYLTTAEDITGSWSNPVFLGSHGFDGSLFHDEDGSKWYLSMRVDQRKGIFFGGIIMQAYDPAAGCLTGPVHHLFSGSGRGNTEGPHIYQKDGYYYLLTAEGGTEYGHTATMARSRSLTGPYELSPHGPLLTTADAPEHPLQKTGHGDLVQTEAGEWFIVFLTGRPLSQQGRCPLGRETAIERVIWPAGAWPRLEASGTEPRLTVPGLPLPERLPMVEKVSFAARQLPSTYHSLRVPITEAWCRPAARPGYLRLMGRESLASTFEQSLLARRIQSFHFSYCLQLDASPQSPQHLAGLVVYYNTGHHFYLHVFGEDAGQQRWLQLVRCDNFIYEECLPEPLLLPPSGEILLRVVGEDGKLAFSYALAIAPSNWHSVGEEQDGSILSDDYIREGSDRYRPAFTGSMVGVACQDLTGHGWPADVAWLAYQGRLP